MGDRHYDSLETRDPDDRERDFFGRLPDLIAVALSALPLLRRMATWSGKSERQTPRRRSKA